MKPGTYNIDDLTVEKVKALLYDEIVKLQNVQNGIEVLQGILRQKLEEEQKEPEVEEPKQEDNLENKQDGVLSDPT